MHRFPESRRTESRSPANAPASSTPTPPWPIFAVWLRGRESLSAAYFGGDEHLGSATRGKAANHRRKRDEGGSRTRIGPGDLTLDRQRRFRLRGRRGTGRRKINGGRVELGRRPSRRRFMAVIYELRGKAAENCELGVNLYSGCAVGCRYCPEPWLRRMTLEQWTTVRGPAENILFHSSAKRKRWRAIRAKSCLSRGRPLSIGRGRPADAKGASYPGAIPLARSRGDAMRHEYRRGFRHFGSQSLEIPDADSLSVGKARPSVGARCPAIRRTRPGARKAHAAGIYTW